MNKDRILSLMDEAGLPREGKHLEIVDYFLADGNEWRGDRKMMADDIKYFHNDYRKGKPITIPHWYNKMLNGYDGDGCSIALGYFYSEKYIEEFIKMAEFMKLLYKELKND